MIFGAFLKIIVATDGAARGNPGPSASGFSIRDNDGKLIHADSIYNGLKTNNFAEYNAVISALQWCMDNLQEHKSVEIELFSDSQLIVRQLTGHYKVRSRDLLHLNEKAGQLAAKFKSISFTSIPREDKRIREVDKALNTLLDTIEKTNKS